MFTYCIGKLGDSTLLKRPTAQHDPTIELFNLREWMRYIYSSTLNLFIVCIEENSGGRELKNEGALW